MSIKKLDELQLIKRGNIFKRCLFTVIGLLLVNLTLLQIEIPIMSQKDMMLCIIQFTVSLFCVQMITGGIYPLGEKRTSLLYYLFGLLGLAFAGISLYELIIQKEALFLDGLISSTGVGLIMSFFALSIVLTYIGQTRYNNKYKEEEDK